MNNIDLIRSLSFNLENYTVQKNIFDSYSNYNFSLNFRKIYGSETICDIEYVIVYFKHNCEAFVRFKIREFISETKVLNNTEKEYFLLNFSNYL